MAERSEASLQKSNVRYFDAKLRFALLASLRSAIFGKTEANNQLVTLPARKIIFSVLHSKNNSA